MTEIEDIAKIINQNKDNFIVPINKIITELKVVKAKKNNPKQKTVPEHLELTIFFPIDIAKNIQEFYNCNYGLVLLGLKITKKKED